MIVSDCIACFNFVFFLYPSVLLVYMWICHVFKVGWLIIPNKRQNKKKVNFSIALTFVLLASFGTISKLYV